MQACQPANRKGLHLPAFEAALTAYEALSIDDKAALEATGHYQKLMALHTVLYGAALMAVNYSTSWQGAGTSTEPYLIANAEELRGIAYVTPETYVYFKLMTDIDLQNEAWTPLSTEEKFIYACLDGDNHVISNFNVNDTYKSNSGYHYSGLFGNMRNGTIKNLGISGATITATNGYGGAVVDYGGVATLINCYVVDSTITGKWVGGLSGGGGGSVSNCYALDTSVSEGMYDYKAVTVKTEDKFASGEVTYLLNSTDTTYRQTLSTDSFPDLKSSSGVVYRRGNEDNYIYSNDAIAYKLMIIK